MSHSQESRVPFLTPDFVELALSLPESYLIDDDGVTKRVFREAMRGIVPDPILDRKDKIGFETPEVKLLARHRAQIDEWLDAADSLAFLNADEVRKAVHGYLDGSKPYKTRCWRLINLCRWRYLMGSDVV